MTSLSTIIQRSDPLQLPWNKWWAIQIIPIALFTMLLIPGIAFAQDSITPTQDIDVLTKILTEFKSKAADWEPIIRGYSLKLFATLLTIDVAWMGIRVALKRAELQDIMSEFIILLFFASLMLAVLVNYKEWANSIISALGGIAQKIGAPVADPTAVFESGFYILSKIWAEASIWSPVTSTVLGLCAIAIIITYSLIAAQLVVVKCEAYIVLNAGAILLGFGGSSYTRDYSINLLRYALSVAVKLFVIQLLIGMSISFVNEFITVNTKNVEEIFLVLGASIIILALTISIPDIVSGIVNGTHVSSGNSLSSAVTSVSAATLAATNSVGSTLGGAVGAKRGVDAIKEACSYADSAGKTGLGKLGHIAGTGAQAVRENLAQGRSGGFRSSVKAQHEAFKMQQQNEPPNE